MGKNVFKARGWARERRQSASIFAEVGKTVAGQFLFALTLVVGLEAIERILIPRLAAFSPIFAGLPGAGIGGALARVAASVQADPQTYTDLLTTMIQVAGIFLGLYFTAVSVVAGTIYARVQGDVLNLFVREKVGNFYIRTVALLGVTATIVLTGHALGYSPGVLNLALIAFLGGLAVLSFVVLGGRVFYFFDPVPLVEYVGQDLAKEIRAVTPEGFRWQDQTFQHHHQRQADNLLETYDNIVHMATREDHLRGEALTQLAASALWLLRFYAQNKTRIPSDSRWFKREYRHKNWLLSNATELETALITGTSLIPEEKPDLMWFERRLEGSVARIVNVLLERGDLRNAADVYDNVQRTTYFLGRHLALDEALALFRSLGGATSKYVRETESVSEAALENSDKLSLVLGLVDVRSVALINILIGSSESLRATTGSSFGEAISQIAWRKRQSIYRGNFPRSVVERLEGLQEGLEAERRLEGHAVSPTWYQQQLAAQGFVQLLSDAAEKLLAVMEDAFADEAEALISDKRHLLAAQVIDRGLEACSKLAVHLAEFEACFARLDELRRVEDIPWPSPEWKTLGDRVGALKERLVRSLAECLPELASVPSSEDLPDYFGHAYTILGEESYHAMSKGDEELFAKIFPPFFESCLSANERLINQLSDRGGTTTAMFSTEPLADLLELSGHAIIYSELEGKGFWQVSKRLWDSYFSSHSKPYDVFDFLSKVVGKREQLFFGITTRGLVRASWQQDLERRLREQGLIDDRLGLAPNGANDVGEHESKLIRVLTRGRHLFCEPHDVFLAVYSSERSELSGCELPDQAKSLADELPEELDDEPKATGGHGEPVRET